MQTWEMEVLAQSMQFDSREHIAYTHMNHFGLFVCKCLWIQGLIY